MGEWQPIESAPKDGTVVLVYGESAGEINGPEKASSCFVASYSNGRGDYSAMGFTWDMGGADTYAVWIRPSRWMPLPAPPGADPRNPHLPL